MPSLITRSCSAASAALLASLLTCAVAGAQSTPSIKLVRAKPKIVKAACRTAQSDVRIRVACPTLIPASRYVHREGLWGSNSYPPDLWWITFNNGDNGPGYVHWMAGGGNMKAIARYVLSDSMNEVKGKPSLVVQRGFSGYRVSIYQYPPHPAGGGAAGRAQPGGLPGTVRPAQRAAPARGGGHAGRGQAAAAAGPQAPGQAGDLTEPSLPAVATTRTRNRKRMETRSPPLAVSR